MEKLTLSVLIFAAMAAPSTGDIPVYDYEVIAVFPHDSAAFTQGLVYENGYLYEGTGLYASSSLRKVELQTGDVLKIRDLPSEYFGEGITIYEDTIVQLTWRNHIGFCYVEGDTFEMVDSFTYVTEGWGLTHDGTHLIMSDGTPTLHFLDPHTYQEVYQIEVTAESNPVRRLNELEYIQGLIYSNVWLTDTIAVIDPLTGDVTAWLNLAGLLGVSRLSKFQNVLNGIAFDPHDVRLFVTGKLWPRLFEIAVPPINYRPRIVASYPPSPCSTGVDSILFLSVQVEDPDPEDTLFYAWAINGEIDSTADDSIYAYQVPIVTVDTITVRVTDGMLADSTRWVVHVSPLSIESVIHPSSTTAPLMAVSPNPFKDWTVVTYRIPVRSHTMLKLYDVSGRVISSLLEGVKEKGSHTHLLDGHRLHSGTYFIKLSAGSTEDVRRLVVIR